MSIGSACGKPARRREMDGDELAGSAQECPLSGVHRGHSAFVLIMNNFIMNVAAIARRLGVVPEVFVYAWLVTADMPFVLLIGPTPNAIACDSRQFSPCEFFKDSVPMSIILLVLPGLAMMTLWPMLDMPIWSIN